MGEVSDPETMFWMSRGLPAINHTFAQDWLIHVPVPVLCGICGHLSHSLILAAQKVGVAVMTDRDVLTDATRM